MRSGIMMAGAAVLALAGCVEDPEVSGRFAFLEDCAACHGAEARGGGPLAADLIRKPPDLTMLARDNGGTFPRFEVMSIIDGYNRGSHFSAAMPEFGAQDMGPTVVVEF